LLTIAWATHAVSAGVPTETRSIVLQRAAIGSYKWSLTTRRIAALKDDQVLVRVRAVSLNHNDIDIRAADAAHDYSGMVAGSDAAGEVAAKGSAVRGYDVGDKVTSLYFGNWVDGPFLARYRICQHGWTCDGVFSDFVVLDQNALAKMPPELTFEEAATLPTAGVTAWSAVTQNGPLQHGDNVLIQGTGGVSIFALQFARAMGAQVIVTSSSDTKLSRVRTLGATAFINYKTTPDWAMEVQRLTSARGVELVVDVGGERTLPQSIASLADGGSLSLVGGLTGYSGTLSALSLIEKRLHVFGVFVGSRKDFDAMSLFVRQHQLHPVIAKVFPLEHYSDALDYLESGDFVGKVVIRWE
jgi:NADPH:quinone reductase-like Zn-dependent oxidoreductase